MFRYYDFHKGADQTEQFGKILTWVKTLKNIFLSQEKRGYYQEIPHSWNTDNLTALWRSDRDPDTTQQQNKTQQKDSN